MSYKSTKKKGKLPSFEEIYGMHIKQRIILFSPFEKMRYYPLSLKNLLQNNPIEIHQQNQKDQNKDLSNRRRRHQGRGKGLGRHCQCWSKC